MSNDGFLNILIAEDNDVSRDMMASILKTKGYQIHGAIDGESAIKVIQDQSIHLAVVDVNMAPTGGFEFVKYLITKGIDIPVVIVTADESSDMLMEATSLGVAKILQKPIEPDRLLQTVNRILSRRGLNPAPLAVEQHTARHEPEDLMRKTIEMAAANVRSGKGRPYAAIVASQDGQVLGTGANGHSSRVDPVAHAEVMAIQQAAQTLGKADLSDCVLYCSSQPTKIGEALVESVSISKVYFGLRHEDSGTSQKEKSETAYEQLCRDEALEMYQNASES